MAKKVHFLGIGGSGASAAAAIAEAQGYEVTGCDLSPHNEFTEVFKSNQLLTGHSPEHLFCHPETSLSLREADEIGPKQSSVIVEDPSLIVQDDNMKNQNDKLIDILAVTPAIYSLDPDNPELLEAKKMGIEVITWQEFLGKYLAKDKFVIAVSGTHGKTTTTAMIAKILEDAGLDPTVELGAIIPWWGTNYRIGKGKYFVVEADEFNDNFLKITPDIAVVTNIEMDHPEYFKDYEAVKASFKKFLLQTQKAAVVNLSDKGVAEVVKKTMKIPHNQGQTSSDRGTFVQIQYVNYHNNELNFPLQIPGRFNIENAKAALQVGLLLGVEPEIIKQSMQSYPGVGRRFEYIGNHKGTKVYSDFGHHPTEIEKTMEAVREKFPTERVFLIYQPHMFSRTKALFPDFVKVFQKVPADRTYILDIYPSRETDTGLVTSKQLVEAVKKQSVSYLGAPSEALDKLKPEIKSGDILFFMSAGDTDKLARELVAS